MKVHARTHTAREKWSHYFWEFLMLFLAVFCGFLAENFREHQVEDRRAKQYMSSMVEDLKLDTAEIGYTINFINNFLLPAQDYSLSLLYTDKLSDSIIKEIYTLVPSSSRDFIFTFQDRTTLQLKNSGNLRLIRKKEVTDSLADYWHHCDYLKNVFFSDYEETRKNIKEMIFSLFDFGNYKQKIPWSSLGENPKLQFLSNDHSQFKKLGNYISYLRNQLLSFIMRHLQIVNEKATRLIILIQKNYLVK